MGANCSNCNCNRDEKEHELNIEGKSSEGGVSKVIQHEQNYINDQSQLHMNDLVRRSIIKREFELDLQEFLYTVYEEQ